MTPQYFITTYGYLAIIVRTFLEGETVLVLGGFAAHRGYLDLPIVIVAAFIGAISGDNLYFFIGRWRGRALLQRFPRFEPRVHKVHRLLERYHTYFILIFRFLYGLRNITPFVIGSSRVPAKRFVILDFVGAAVWAVLVAGLGYLFGQAMEAIIGDIKRYEREVMLVIACIGILIWFVHLYRRKKIKPD